MIDPADHVSLGSALAAAFERWGSHVAHIESDRDRERHRRTFSEMGALRLTLAAFLSERGVGPGDRVALLMTNQGRWHLAAAAAFHLGAVVVPLDWKLSGAEHWALLAHARPRLVLADFPIWRALAAAGEGAAAPFATAVVNEAPDSATLATLPGCEVVRWRDTELADAAPPPLAERSRADIACLVYSSGTGGRPKGCLLTHGNYLTQFAALSELHPFRPGVRYLSILPTNHAIDFMVGFLGPYFCGATVIHLRTLRPEFVRAAISHYRVTHFALVPLVLKNLENGLRERFAALPPLRHRMLCALIRLQRVLSRGRPRPALGRRLLPAVHDAFGGRLEALFVGGAYTDPATLRFFHDLGIAVANGYGLTEAGTAITLDRLDPPRPETVGQPLPGVEVRIDRPNDEGIGEVIVRSPMVMQGYEADPELTAETIRNGWLFTGDLGRLEDGALRIFGRSKNMIVTAGGKNVYPEDIEVAYEGLDAVSEHCIFAAHYLWPAADAADERLVLVLHGERAVDDTVLGEVAQRNRRLPDFKRVAAVLAHDQDFPRTASMKLKRGHLAEELRAATTPNDLLALS